MSIFSGLKSIFRRKRQPDQRGYQALAALGGQFSDWAVNVLGEDADVKQNIMLLRGRSRDLFKTNPYFVKYREELWANVFGEHGISLRMKVKETEDRVVHAEEKAQIEIHQARWNRVFEWAATKTGRELRRLVMTRQNDRGEAMIIAGQLDVYANKIIEDRFAEWRRAEFCDIRGRRDYVTLQQIRLLSAVRDGDFFILKIRDPQINKFGFSIQLVNAEWVDNWLNLTLDNGNVVRMGIEYQMTKWGVGKPVAFYFIKRHPNDWEWSSPGSMFRFVDGQTHDRIDAADVIHYARFTDQDSTRPAPWIAPVIPKARQLDSYELAEVIAARTAACKMGWFYSDIVPDGGDFVQPNPEEMNERQIKAKAGGFHGLPYGVKFQEFDPNHPNGNFDEFRKGMLRSLCAGMPGANYNIIANDGEGVSYSTGRIFSLDDRELWKLIQRFDINTAERPIFEAFLEQALITRAIPLSLAKYTKYNKPNFSGRRWSWVDPAKDAAANLQQLLLGITSRTRLTDNNDGGDWDNIILEVAEEEMMIEDVGLSGSLGLSVLAGAGEKEEPDEETDEEDEETDPKAKERKKPRKKRKAA
jgi:lambda family phage portal protein